MKHNAISSKVDDVSKLRFYPLPTRPVPASRAMRSGKAHVIVDAKGKVYTTQANTWCYWTTAQRMDDTVRALVKMGMLTDRALAQHKEAEDAETKAYNDFRNARDILDAVDAGGIIKLTAAQQKKLDAIVAARKRGAL